MTQQFKYTKGQYIWEKSHIEKSIIFSDPRVVISSGPKWVTFKRIAGLRRKYQLDYNSMTTYKIAFGDPVYEN